MKKIIIDGVQCAILCILLILFIIPDDSSISLGK